MDTKQHVDTASPITGLGIRTAKPGPVRTRMARGGAVKYASVLPATKSAKTKLTSKEQALGVPVMDEAELQRLLGSA